MENKIIIINGENNDRTKTFYLILKDSIQFTTWNPIILIIEDIDSVETLINNYNCTSILLLRGDTSPELNYDYIIGEDENVVVAAGIIAEDMSRAQRIVERLKWENCNIDSIDLEFLEEGNE